MTPLRFRYVLAPLCLLTPLNDVIQWLQSERQAHIFDVVFVRVNPRYLESVSPLISLSVSATITATFETHVEQRLEYLSVVLNNIDLADPDITDVAPRIMDVLSQRLQGAYMAISETRPGSPTLKTISLLNRQVHEVRKVYG